MRLFALAGALAALVPGIAAAQPAPVWIPALPVAPADMINYCIYDSRIYSIGSGLCVGHLGYVCLPSTGPATGTRAYWTSKDDQLFPRPTCN